MNNYRDIAIAANWPPSSLGKSQKKTEKGRMDDFLAALKKFDEISRQMKAANDREKKAKEKERQDKRLRDERINELRGLIARYRSIAMRGGPDAGRALAIASSFESELIRLMFVF